MRTQIGFNPQYNLSKPAKYELLRKSINATVLVIHLLLHLHTAVNQKKNPRNAISLEQKLL